MGNLFLDDRTKINCFKRFASLSVKRLNVLNTVEHTDNVNIKTYLQSYADELEQQKIDDKIFYNLNTYE